MYKTGQQKQENVLEANDCILPWHRSPSLEPHGFQSTQAAAKLTSTAIIQSAQQSTAAADGFVWPQNWPVQAAIVFQFLGPEQSRWPCCQAVPYRQFLPLFPEHTPCHVHRKISL